MNFCPEVFGWLSTECIPIVFCNAVPLLLSTAIHLTMKFGTSGYKLRFENNAMKIHRDKILNREWNRLLLLTPCDMMNTLLL